MALLTPNRPVLASHPASFPGGDSSAGPGHPPLNATTLAVITASVHHMLRGRPHRITIVAPMEPLDWAREGRRIIWHSHKLR